MVTIQTAWTFGYNDILSGCCLAEVNTYKATSSIPKENSNIYQKMRGPIIYKAVCFFRTCKKFDRLSLTAVASGMPGVWNRASRMVHERERSLFKLMFQFLRLSFDCLNCLFPGPHYPLIGIVLRKRDW
jgi:hypothetical protein